MAFTLKPDGSIQTETAEELLQLMALQKRGAADLPPKAAQASTPATPAVPTRLADQPGGVYVDTNVLLAFYQSIDDERQRRLLQTLLSAPRTFTDAELRLALSLPDNVALRGALIGIVRRANNRHIPSPLVKHMTRTNGGLKRSYRYGVTPDFRRAMEAFDLGEKRAV